MTATNMCSNFDGFRCRLPLAHTTSNKLVSKVPAQKKGEKHYDSYKCVQILVVSGVVLPIKDPNPTLPRVL